VDGRDKPDHDEYMGRRLPSKTMADLLDRITVDPEKCGGRPCIRGLRVRVKDVLDMLAGGSSREEILRDYPYLEDDDITAALEFASRATDHPVFTASGP
jgi:uncharacterized protein (DUF433 family)